MITENDIKAYVDMPTYFTEGCSNNMLYSVLMEEITSQIMEYLKECFCSLTQKSPLRKVRFPAMKTKTMTIIHDSKYQINLLPDINTLADWY